MIFLGGMYGFVICWISVCSLWFFLCCYFLECVCFVWVGGGCNVCVVFEWFVFWNLCGIGDCVVVIWVCLFLGFLCVFLLGCGFNELDFLGYFWLLLCRVIFWVLVLEVWRGWFFSVFLGGGVCRILFFKKLFSFWVSKLF